MDNHLIKNFNALSTTPLRRDALTILESGLNAINTKTALASKVSLSGNQLTVGARQYDLNKIGRIFVVAIGKAAIEAAKTLEDLLQTRISGGFVLDTRKQKFNYLESIECTHPYPSQKNIDAANKIVQLLEETNKDDLVIAVITGGGSAIFTRPHKLNFKQVADITRALMDQGATIQEINTVRKHISTIKGGQLAALAHPAEVIGLIFSDIPDNDLSFVASGPTYQDDTSISDAKAVLEKYRISEKTRISNIPLLETPKNKELFNHVHNELIVSNETAANAMKTTAQELGYKSRILSTNITGEARAIGPMLAEEPLPGEAVIATGETTVIVRNPGMGGRNMEVALSAVPHVNSDTLVISCASDGIDSMPIAGGISDHAVKETAKELQMDVDYYLNMNSSYVFFHRVGSAIDTGPTGANVSDLMLAIKAKA
jgi:glycerate-2-kinase